MTSSWARTRSAAVRRVGSAARATYCWLIIHIYILDFHSTFLVVLFRSVFSGNRSVPVTRNHIGHR